MTLTGPAAGRAPRAENPAGPNPMIPAHMILGRNDVDVFIASPKEMLSPI
jgi:hypothetical protein